MMPKVPHYQSILVFCLLAIVGYAACSWWVVTISEDAALRGDTIGTWKSFATLAFGFWIGSSSGGKARDAQSINPSPDTPADGTLLLDTPAPAQQQQT